jgi:thiamine monophosphate synthase
MPNDDIIAIAREIDNLLDLQSDTIQPAKSKGISASQLREYDLRHTRIKQLCAQLEEIGRRG